MRWPLFQCLGAARLTLLIPAVKGGTWRADLLQRLADRLVRLLNDFDDFGLLEGGASHEPSSPSPIMLFELSDFQRLLRQHFLQHGGFLPQVLHLVGGRSPGRIARQTPLARLQELFGPSIIDVLGDAFAAALLSQAFLIAK